MTIKSAEDCLAPGETAIAVCTDGTLLTMNPDGTGETGNWVVSATAHVDRVVLYKCDDGSSKAEVFVAAFIDVRASDQLGRRIISFANAKRVGDTSASWRDFAQTRQNPIRYVERAKAEGPA